ncbi:serine hydrolase domain-containing protein [Algoriphagus litoralis]|uniref:serine hydrolase domain-containing protein n=1 Tax=Algoriphagus litoralis TaxID=2202829 RepID=UPI000DB9EE82|nr:serine hydrolase domain-containing protein [Algoriphagus litoralis]
MTSRLFFFFGILFLNACTSDTQSNVEKVFEKWNSTKTPGVAIAVVKNGEIIFKKGYGMANLEYNIPVTPKTIFHIASVSKQFTVFSILLLEKDGKLSLEDDIRKYIPEVPDFGKTITLRHLATHTSGLRDQWNLLALAGWRLDDVITRDQIMKLISAQEELNFDPGEEFLYCNTGFTLLAEVVSRVSGQSFSTFTDERIFKPLQMESTLFYEDHEMIVPNRAYSYYPDRAGYKKSVLSYANAGATSLMTTVEDLSLWAINFSDPKVGDETIFQEMNTLGRLNNGETFGGAMGQFVGQYKGVEEISHGGADAGFRTYLARYPEQQLSVIVFSNDASFSSGQFAHDVADLYLEIETPVEVEKVDSVAGPKLGLEILAKYLGDYELKSGTLVYVSDRDDNLYIQASGEPEFLLKPVADNRFVIAEAEIEIEFLNEENSLTQSVKVYYSNDDTEEGTRVAPFDPSSAKLEEFLGTFYSEELSTAYHFQIKDDQLVATHYRHPDIYFQAVKKDVFRAECWFFGQAEFIRNKSENVIGLKATSARARNIKFEKKD